MRLKGCLMSNQVRCLTHCLRVCMGFKIKGRTVVVSAAFAYLFLFVYLCLFQLWLSYTQQLVALETSFSFFTFLLSLFHPF